MHPNYQLVTEKNAKMLSNNKLIFRLTSIDTANITSKPALSKNFIGQTSCQCDFQEFEQV